MSLAFYRVYRAFFCLGFLSLAGCAAGTVYLDTSDHFPVAYELKRVPEAKGAVLLLHGLGTSLDEWYNFGKDLRRDGWTTLAVDLRGHGQSTFFDGEEVHWQQLTAEGRQSTLNDVDAATQYLKKHVPEAEKKLWIVGSSFGGSLAFKYAAAHPSVQGVVLISPGISYGDIPIEREARLFSKGKVLMVAAEDDVWSVREGTELLDWIPSGEKKLLTRPKGGHGAQMLETAQDLKNEVLEWMNQESSKTPKTISG